MDSKPDIVLVDPKAPLMENTPFYCPSKGEINYCVNWIDRSSVWYKARSLTGLEWLLFVLRFFKTIDSRAIDYDRGLYGLDRLAVNYM